MDKFFTGTRDPEARSKGLRSNILPKTRKERQVNQAEGGS